MSILLGDNFQYQAAKPLDGRLKYDTLANMKAVGDSTMYDGCLAYCVATDKTYQWKSTNSVDSSTGRWREFSSGGGDDANAYHTTDTAETTLADGDYFPFYDTSASGARKSLWSNIKSVLKTYFDSVYQKTLTAGTNISFSGTNNTTINASMPVMGTFSKGDLYDTTEKVIGKWTDGRPLYQKTISLGYGPSSGTKNIAHGISNLGTVVDIHGQGLILSGGATSVAVSLDSSSISSSNNNKYDIFLSGSNICIDTNVDLSSVTFYATVKYTKTTDAANSYNYASENDYSTSEKIIGTWIDGSTLYQKTYTGNAPTTADTTIEAITLPSNYLVKYLDCYFHTADGKTILPANGYCIKNNGGVYDYLATYVSGNVVKMKLSSSYSGASAKYMLTIKYTKS